MKRSFITLLLAVGVISCASNSAKNIAQPKHIKLKTPDHCFDRITLDASGNTIEFTDMLCPSRAF